MAEKVLKTKIKLRYDTYAKWTAANPVLEKGEIAVVEIDTKDPANKLLPPIMFRVGNGQSNSEGVKLKFNDLNWSSALAADVYDWAKKSGVETTTTGSGSFVSNISWDSTNNKLVITKSNISGYVPDTRTVAGKALSADISAADLRTALNVADGATNVTADTVGEWGFTKNKGTVTGIKMNNASKTVASDGTVDLGTVITDVSGKQNRSISNVSGITATTVEGALTEAKKAGTDAAAAAVAAQTTANEAKTGLTNKVDKTTKVNGHALSADVTVTKEDVGLKLVENKALDTTVTKDSGNYITSGAVKTAIDGAISGVTQFDIQKYDSFDKLPTTGKKGVIYIVAHAHGTNDSYDEYIWNTALTTPAYEKIGNTDVNLSQYVNELSGTANSGVITNLTKSGTKLTVTSTSLATTAPTSSGNTLQFIDSVSQAANGKISATKKQVQTATTSQLGVVKAGTTNGKVYGVDVAADGAMTVNVPWTDTKVTSAANHYTPSAETASQLSVDASSTVAATWNSTSMVTGVNIQRDSKGHVTGVTVDSVKMPANPNTDHNQKVKSGSVTFGANDEVNIIGASGSGIKATGNQSAKSITIDWDDTVTLVFDCGDSSGPK